MTSAKKLLTPDQIKEIMLQQSRLQYKFLRLQEHLRDASQGSDIIFTKEQLTTMTESSMSSVLGPLFNDVDTYSVRARMPSPPFQFVDRVTRLDAEIGVLKANSSIEFEHDIPEDSMFSLSSGLSQVPLFESGHAGILLMGILGSDLISKGMSRFRVTDTDLIFRGRLPKAGDTVKGIFTLTDVIQNAKKLVVFYDFNLYHLDGSPIFESKGLGGFFTESELKDSKGVKSNTLQKKKELRSKKGISFISSKASFSKEELQDLSKGKLAKVLGPDYKDVEFNKLLFNEKIQVLDRVVSLSSTGGDHGLGEIVGEWEVPAEHWMFDAHFKNDPIMPGMMMLEGASQCFRLLSLLSAGTKISSSKLEVQPLDNVSIKTWFRGQVEKASGTITYKLSVRDYSESNGIFKLVCDVKIYHRQKLIVVCNSLAAVFRG